MTQVELHMLATSATEPFPISDTQFWLVSVIALLAAIFIVWRALGGRLRRRKPKPRKSSATLTIEGKVVDRKAPPKP